MYDTKLVATARRGAALTRKRRRGDGFGARISAVACDRQMADTPAHGHATVTHTTIGHCRYQYGEGAAVRSRARALMNAEKRRVIGA